MEFVREITTLQTDSTNLKPEHSKDEIFVPDYANVLLEKIYASSNVSFWCKAYDVKTMKRLPDLDNHFYKWYLQAV